jgi:hypothetical protein
MMDGWLGLCELSLAVGAASFTVARAGIFAPVRDWTKRRSAWLGNLLSCPWCVSHWIAVVAVIAGDPPASPYANRAADSAVSIFVLVAGAGLFVNALEALGRAWQPKPAPPKPAKRTGRKERAAGGSP